MGLFDGIRKQVSKTADSLVKQVSSTADTVAKQATKTAGSVVKQVSNTADTVAKQATKTAGSVVKQVSNTTEDLAKQAVNTANALAKQAENTANNVKEQAEKLPESVMETSTSLLEKTKKAFQKTEATDLIRSEDAVRVLYYLMAADGVVSPEEIEKFNEIGADIDSGFETKKESLMQECEGFLEKAADEQERYDILHEHAAEAIRSSRASEDGQIRPRLFLWNLLAIAFADGEYSENEVRLIRAMARLMEVDPVIVKEMESTIRTLLALEQETDWLKKSGRPYADVEFQLNELADRKNVVIQGIKALLLD